MNRRLAASFSVLLLLVFQAAHAADTVPDLLRMPGTQPQEIGNLESPGKCDNCHGGYNSSVEPAHNWRGSMMANAGRDPIFWATLAIAEQDFDGAGDLCIRCHSTAGWLAGRSTPTDGSGLAAGDSDGVECDYCHKLTNPNDLEHQGVMNAPFIAKDPVSGEGYYGSGMSSLWAGSDKLGPYNNAEARHQFMQSEFHRDRDFCGTCHDVSNPVTGDLAHNFGALYTDEIVPPGEGLDQQVSFKNPPYRYGIVERTFSEFKAGAISKTLVDDYQAKLASQGLTGGALEAVYNAAYDPGSGSANYQNPPAPRYFSCQTCHMRAVTGKGANKNGAPTRVDLPLHDMTGGNYWMAEAIKYLDGKGKLRLGGGLSGGQIQAMDDAALRAREQLELAASLKVEGNEVYIYNHTGHKLITGYPEGRRMWLNVKWYAGSTELTEDEIGAYGPVTTIVFDGQSYQPESLLDLYTTPVWEAHMGMTSEWAAQLIDLGVPGSLVLDYDRGTGAEGMSLQDLALQDPGTTVATFHFVLNNTVEKDNRIPPYGMDKAEAIRRNAAPLDLNEYATYQLDGTEVFVHYDEVYLNPPAGADSAIVSLMYQPTSWEYIQFLYLANNGQNAFLADEGRNMLEAWLQTGMAAPVVMASATWGSGEPPPPECSLQAPSLVSATPGNGEVTVTWSGPSGNDYDGYSLYYDQADKAQKVADLPCPGQVCNRTYTDTSVTNGNEYCYKLTSTANEPEGCESGFSNILCATPNSSGDVQYASVAITGTGVWEKSGKGKAATLTWVPKTAFAPGEQVVVLLEVTDSLGLPVTNATATLAVTGPESHGLTAGASDNGGNAEGTWSTQSPNRKGNGGTTEGSYQISVSGLSSSTHEWDGSSAAVTVTIDSSATTAGSRHHSRRM